MVSVIIPARHEQYLEKTVRSLLDKARGELEVVVVLDGYWPEPFPEFDKRVNFIHFGEQKGMRAAINAGVAFAKGQYVMKLDGHCLMADGFDLQLVKDHQPKWTIVPTAFQLSGKNWEPKPRHRRDFQYLDRTTLKGHDWGDFENRVNGDKLCDLMTFQGSCWFMEKSWFEFIGGEDDVNYGWTGREAQEISLKTWLMGGRCVLDKNTWYAHYNKPKEEVVVSKSQKKKSVAFALEYWNNFKGERDLSWLYDKFAPVPIHVEFEVVKEESKKGMCREDIYRIFAAKYYKLGAEIGVWDGSNASSILNLVPDVKLILVDMYKYFVGSQHRQPRFDKAKRRARKKVGNSNVKWIEKSSELASQDIPDGSLDFVYIDCDHSYDYAMQDIIMWSRKVRKGGMVAGHDYVSSKEQNVGVMDAVNDYCRFHNIKFNVTDSISETPRRDGSPGIPSWYWEVK